MRIGLIQTRGIGDIVIALPIAAWHLRQGHEVPWPVDAQWLPFLQAAAPQVSFLPVDAALRGTLAYMLDEPRRLLQAQGCDKIVSLYSYVKGRADLVEPRLAGSLKFDEYKYAVAGVPFAEKWALQLVRDRPAEQRLIERLGLSGPYAVVHDQGSNFRFDIQIPAAVSAQLQVVRIEPLTVNPFDWIGVLEGASMLAMIDSCFSNLVEQMDLGRNRHFFLRSAVGFTPVFRNAWTFY